MARNPPTCPAEKRSVGENLVNDGQMWCSAQVRLRMDVREDSISLCEISPLSHCYSIPYMKIPANNQVFLVNFSCLVSCIFKVTSSYFFFSWQLAGSLAEVLSDKKLEGVTEDYLLLINHPSTCSNVLKVRGQRSWRWDKERGYVPDIHYKSNVLLVVEHQI